MSQKKISFTLKELSKIIDAKITGDENIIISNIATIQDANKESITFLANKKYAKFITSCSASALIVHTEDKVDSDITLLKCSDPYLAYAKISSLFAIKKNMNNSFIHKSADISTSSKISELVTISANVIIEENVIIEDGVFIGPNCFIGSNCHLKKNSIINANSSFIKDVSLGASSIVHSGSVIGGDGFCYAPSEHGYEKIE